MGSSLSLNTALSLLENFLSLLPNVFSKFFHYMCMRLFPAGIPVSYMHTWCPGIPEKGTRSPGMGLQTSRSCYVCVENEPGPPEE